MPITMEAKRVARRKDRILEAVMGQSVPYTKLAAETTDNSPKKLEQYAEKRQQNLEALTKEQEKRQMNEVRTKPFIVSEV